MVAQHAACVHHTHVAMNETSGICRLISTDVLVPNVVYLCIFTIC